MEDLEKFEDTSLLPDSNLPLRLLALVDHLAGYLDIRGLSYVYTLIMSLLSNEAIEDQQGLILLSAYVQALVQDMEAGGDPNESEDLKDMRANIDEVIY